MVKAAMFELVGRVFASIVEVAVAVSAFVRWRFRKKDHE